MPEENTTAGTSIRISHHAYYIQMIAKLKEKNIARDLRSKGYTYSEIQKIVDVSQATLSNWLKTISLSNEQVNRILEKQELKRRLGNQIRKENTKNIILKLYQKSQLSIKKITKYDLLLIGTALYWAEGSKQNKKSVSQGLVFSNSDPKMILLYYKWLRICLEVNESEIYFEVYLHEDRNKSKNEIINYWSNILSVNSKKFDRIYIKKNSSKKSYSNREYFGLIRVIVKKSTNLNRQVSGYIIGICNKCGIV